MSVHPSLPVLPSEPGSRSFQPYGDLVQFNTSREVLDAVGKEVLATIAEDYLELLGTSSAVYERNGDYALGIFSSGWCRFMDAAAYRLCGKDDPREALASGQWHCHESCWTASREAMQSRGEVDVECAGGIRLFAFPIIAAGEVVGSINFGYGDPPQDPERLAELAEKYEVSVEDMKVHSQAYEPRAPEVIEMAKRRLRASAKLIGEIVARKRAEETLRESEHRFRFLADAVPQQVWVTRPDGYHEYYNQRWYDYTGLTLAQTEGDGWNAVLHPNDRQRAWDRWRHSLATGEPYEIEYRFRRHDGEYRWFLGQALPQRNDRGEVVRWFGSLTDIHDRYAAAEDRERLLNAALESEERYTLVARATNDVIWDWDLATDEVVWNEALERTFGYSPGAVPSRVEFWYNHVHPEDRERVVTSIHAALDAGDSSWTSEYRFVRADGSPVTVLDRGFIAQDESGKPTRMIGSMLDISERDCLLAAERRARQEAEHTAQVMSLITTHLGDGICMMDAQGRLTYMNPAAERILGWTQAEIEGRVLHDVVHYKYPDGRPFPIEECPLGRVLSAAEPVLNMSDQWVRKDGSFVHLVTTCSPIVSDGSVAGAVLSMHDDTERRQAEAEREKLLRAEQAARADAELANQAKMDFLSAMSHELRTPLNAIGGYVDLLDMGIHGPVTQAQQTALARVRASQQHLLTLINDVLAFARLEAGRIEFDSHPLIVSDVLASVEPLIGPLAEAKGIALSVQECEPSLQIIGDAERVRQILLNLTGNAIKFTPEGGWVALSCEVGEKWVLIRVQDNGPGIEEAKQERIFDPFVQADRRLNRPQDGVGLGLAISRDLARGMGGDLTVESTPGQGSTFTLVLPPATCDLKG